MPTFGRIVKRPGKRRKNLMKASGQYLTLQEITLIELLKKEGSKSKSMNKVCNEIFFSNKSVSELAKERGVTYHAIYQTTYKVKKRLADILSKSKYCSYNIIELTTEKFTLERK